jgi:hypothetical protein
MRSDDPAALSIGIGFGTSSTVVALADRAGRVEAIRFDHHAQAGAGRLRGGPLRRFGENRLVSSDPLSSIASGLALVGQTADPRAWAVG